MLELKTFVDQTREYVSSYLTQNNIHDVVIGISGGVDSAVSLALLQQVENLHIHAYFMDIDSSHQAFQDAQSVCHHLNVELHNVSLKNSFTTIVEEFGSPLMVQKTNLKARLRMMYLYHQAMACHGIVIGNSNADELYLGYYTKFADNAADMMLLNNLSKQEVVALAQHFHLPAAIINKAPSADLYEGQTDEQEFGFTYADVDEFLATSQSPQTSVQQQIATFHAKNLHKSKVVTNPYFLSRKGSYE